ncbi:MAG TPA: glycosyltransferase [Chthonomonadaceae bacterium]|nr:glycosyltransferase [Chthonomonadaceae bacterium]
MPREQRIRLALFTDSLEPSGVGRVMEMLARHLPRQRYALFLICADHPGADGLAERMQPYVAGMARYTVRGDTDLPALAALARQLRAWRIHIFHNHIGATWEGDWGTIAARCAGVPLVVATDHLPCVLKLDQELEHRRRVNRLLHRSFAVSESVRQSLVECSLIAAEKAFTVENGVEAPRLLPTRADARQALGLPEDAPVALFVGRLTEQKDPGLLLRALSRLDSVDACAHALIAGDGPLRGELEREAQQLGIAGRVRFLGHWRDVPGLLAAADALVMPSRFEGLPLAVLEAMAVGLPVVGCDAPGVRDAVEHGVTGWLAPIGDHAALAQGLRLAFAPETDCRWSAAAKARYRQRFTARQMAERQDRAYQEALASLARRRRQTPSTAVVARTFDVGAGIRESPSLSR